MSYANAPILSWTSTTEQMSGTPLDGEHIRNYVIPTTPRKLTTPAGSSRHWQTSPSAEAAQLQHLLRIQSEDLMNMMESLMLRQSATIKDLLAANSMSCVSLNHTSSHTDQPGVTMQDCKSKVANSSQTQYGTKPAMPSDDEVNVNSSSSYEGARNEMISVPRKETRKSTDLSSHLSFKKDYRKMHSVSTESQAALPVRNHRELFVRILGSRAYDVVMISVISFNSILIVADTDANAGCGADGDCGPNWMWYANTSLLLIYTVESLMVLDAYRWHVLKDRSRLLEMFVVISGFVDLLVVKLFGTALPSMHILKLVRLTRILRGARLFHMFPELYSIVNGFIGAMRAMLWGFFLLVLLVMFLSIIAVELVHDVNKKVQQESQYCHEALDSVSLAALLFFQILLASDEWGACSIKIIKQEPLAFLLFGVSAIAVQVGLMNLIMSVIIERVADARAADTAQRLRDKDKEIHASRNKWLNLFDKVDTDGSGGLGIFELLSGFDGMPDFGDDLRLLGIERDDLPTLLKLMDEDENGHLDVDELLSLLDTMWRFDTKMHQVTMSMKLRLAFKKLDRRLKGIEDNFLELL